MAGVLRPAAGPPIVLAGPGPWRLGRLESVEIPFPDDESCSRLHAVVTRSEQRYLIEIISTHAPTALDGRRLGAGMFPLTPGSIIALGAQILTFAMEDEAATSGAGADTHIASCETNPDYIPVPAAALAIGRQPLPGQVVLDHPTISRRHAVLEPAQGGVRLRDLGSINGTFVNGTRIGTVTLASGDRIDIGPFQLVFDGAGLSRASRAGNAALVARGVGRVVGKNRQCILDRVSLRIPARRLVCIIGASGSGKSTLMNILSGRARPTQGEVLLNGQNLHANFAALKQDVAFVPQQDVLHEQLTLRQALGYAARLRLPPDTTAEQRHVIVAAAAASVDLTDRLDTRIGALSGGQKKRSSLASEILSRPSLLFLDEVTSGLDESTDWEIMRLLRRLANDGMTIVAVTHTLANVEEFCHDVICLGRGGHLTFAGTPAAALAFFGAERLGSLFSIMERDGPERWRDRFGAPMEVAAPAYLPPQAGRVGRTSPGLILRQFGILTGRNLRLLLTDRRTLVMAAVQSLLIGGLIGYAFKDFGEGLERVNAQNALLLLLGLCAIWLGCNAASKDIVGELVIYRRERDINLSTCAFVLSKYFISGLFTMLQLVVAFLLVMASADSIPGRPPSQMVLLLLGAAAGTAIGLVISAFADTRDQATTIVPLALVPQLILAGVLVPKLPHAAEQIAKLAVSGYWLTEAMKSVFIASSAKPVLIMNAHTGLQIPMTAQPATLGALVITLHAVAFLTIAYLATLIRNRPGQS